MAAYSNQSGPVTLSLSALSVRFLLGLSSLFKLFVALLLSPRSKIVVSGLSPLFHLFGAFLLSPRSKTSISSWSPGLLAIFLYSYTLSHISERYRAPTILFRILKKGNQSFSAHVLTLSARSFISAHAHFRRCAFEDVHTYI